MAHESRAKATLSDLLAIPETSRFCELLDGVLVDKAAPSPAHGDAQSAVVSVLKPAFQRRSGSGGPGGWWILTEVEVLLDTGDVVRPDVVGWRREGCPSRPEDTPVRQRPDWICEVVSPARANDDTVRKLRLYHRAGLAHYWIVDPRDETLTVLRHSELGFITVLRAERGEIVRPEPFEAMALAVGILFGDDPV
jgi:Uma2 family endonuclease